MLILKTFNHCSSRVSLLRGRSHDNVLKLDTPFEVINGPFIVKGAVALFCKQTISV